MIGALFPSSSPQHILPDTRWTGTMPWVLVIMTFLTVLAVAAGLSLSRAASSIGGDMARAMTVQVTDANAKRRERLANDVMSALKGHQAVSAVSRLSDAETRALLVPWFGDSGLDSDIPVPVLIDVVLEDSAKEPLVRDAVLRAVPTARIERNAESLGPLRRLLTTLGGLAAALIALMTAAMAAVVVLASRAALNTHKATIDVMHLIGATDSQVAQLFQRRAAIDATLGSVTGMVAGLIVVGIIAYQLRSAGVALFDGGGLGFGGWFALLSVPVFVTGLAVLVSRFTVLAALRALP